MEGTAPGGLRLPPPLLGQKKTKKKLKQQSSGGRGRVGAIGTVRGIVEVTPLRPPLILVLGVGGFPPRGGGGVRGQGGGGGVPATRRRTQRRAPGTAGEVGAVRGRRRQRKF